MAKSNMLQWLVQYDPEAPVEELEAATGFINSQLDITDRSRLENQVNEVRRGQWRLIGLHDKLQGDLIRARTELNDRMRVISASATNRTEASKVAASDVDVSALNERIEALQMAIRTVSSAISMATSDLRILTSSMYQKGG